MILIDALYINNSGGKILLDYLVKELEKTGSNFYYLFDARCNGEYADIPTNRKLYLKASLLNRHQFYKENKNKFSKVFCFGNLPPTIKLNIVVYTYFHQRFYLELPKDINIKQKVLFTIKSKIFKILQKNTDYFIVQSGRMKEDFLKTLPLFKRDNIKIIPFYQSLEYPLNIYRIKHRMIYVSGGSIHKNHFRLIHAFKNTYDLLHKGELVLTIDESFVELNELINDLKNKGYPITNLGFINKDVLAVEYTKAEYTIFPSLLESFGLGIVEAIEGGCKVIGADLPYMHAVCSPSIKFNPLDIKSIQNAIEEAIIGECLEAKQFINNKINNLVNLLID